MKKLVISAVLAAATFAGGAFAAEIDQPGEEVAEQATAPLQASRGAMLYGADGNRVGRVYSVDADGNVQLIMNSKMVTVPASTLSEVDGKLTTTMTKREVRSGGK